MNIDDKNRLSSNTDNYIKNIEIQGERVFKAGTTYFVIDRPHDQIYPSEGVTYSNRYKPVFNSINIFLPKKNNLYFALPYLYELQQLVLDVAHMSTDEVASVYFSKFSDELESAKKVYELYKLMYDTTHVGNLDDASQIIEERFHYLVNKHGFKFRSFYIGSGEFFGTCNDQAEIIISRFVGFFPEIIVDHVIVHEFMHVLHPNNDHSDEFWKDFENVFPDALLITKVVNFFKIAMVINRPELYVNLFRPQLEVAH